MDKRQFFKQVGLKKIDIHMEKTINLGTILIPLQMLAQKNLASQREKHIVLKDNAYNAHWHHSGAICQHGSRKEEHFPKHNHNFYLLCLL